MLFYDENGLPVPGIHLAAHVFRPPNVEVFRYVEPEGLPKPPEPIGGDGLVFPVTPQWIATGGGRALDVWVLPPYTGWERVEIDPLRALERFVKIETALDVHQFAFRFGPLWMCQRHGLKCKHSSPLYQQECVWFDRERIEDWLQTAKLMRSAMSAAARLRQGERPTREELSVLDLHGLRSERPRRSRFVLELEAWPLVELINDQLQRLGVHIGLTDDLRLGMDMGIGVNPILWQQLAAVVAGGRVVAFCSNCGAPYVRHTRAPKRGFRNYCTDCSAPKVRKRMSRQANVQGSGGMEV